MTARTEVENQVSWPGTYDDLCDFLRGYAGHEVSVMADPVLYADGILDPSSGERDPHSASFALDDARGEQIALMWIHENQVKDVTIGRSGHVEWREGQEVVSVMNHAKFCVEVRGLDDPDEGLLLQLLKVQVSHWDKTPLPLARVS
jgi:hypothetical protein